MSNDAEDFVYFLSVLASSPFPFSPSSSLLSALPPPISFSSEYFPSSSPPSPPLYPLYPLYPLPSIRSPLTSLAPLTPPPPSLPLFHDLLSMPSSPYTVPFSLSSSTKELPNTDDSQVISKKRKILGDSDSDSDSDSYDSSQRKNVIPNRSPHIISLYFLMKQITEDEFIFATKLSQEEREILSQHIKQHQKELSKLILSHPIKVALLFADKKDPTISVKDGIYSSLSETRGKGLRASSKLSAFQKNNTNYGFLTASAMIRGHSCVVFGRLKYFEEGRLELLPYIKRSDRLSRKKKKQCLSDKREMTIVS